MSKVKILIVEDEAIIADNIFDTLNELDYEALEPAHTFSEAIEKIDAFDPDIAILDIQLSGKKSGIDLANRINEIYHFPFIFLTSNSEQFTLEHAKKVEPSAFLVKPFGKEELYTSIEVALFNYSKRVEKAFDKSSLIIQDALFIKENKTFIRLNFDEIVHLKSDHVYIEISMQNGESYSVRGSMNDYINRLNDSFYRTHRSHIINLKYLVKLNQNTITVLNTNVPIGKLQRDELMARLNKG